MLRRLKFMNKKQHFLCRRDRRCSMVLQRSSERRSLEVFNQIDCSEAVRSFTRIGLQMNEAESQSVNVLLQAVFPRRNGCHCLFLREGQSGMKSTSLLWMQRQRCPAVNPLYFKHIYIYILNIYIYTFIYIHIPTYVQYI